MMVHSDVTGEKHSMLITFPIMQNNQSKQRHIYVHADNSFVSENSILARYFTFFETIRLSYSSRLNRILPRISTKPQIH